MANNSILSGGGFHHIAIRVADFEASIRFYEALGFREKIRWGEGDSRGILLDSGDGNYMEIFAGGTREPKPEGALLHVAFRTDDINAAIEVARAAGAEVTVEPKDLIICPDPRTPVRIAFFKGPDGELIELFQSTGENPL
ncbi:glyoxalase/bleomycin resistance/dioxygenase family protein [Paenibacillus sp. 598K]|uniref:VOC family protein n=1 Tax=Paenibacillus sp. 598K TaxID=1117987 RepID=UPI000FFA4AC5|nr:VOC family protein [Paenibacillus sp. 598K]GBF74922.1 glyoxalase/bleomycin resistance/dioxygenase family protein [Paenibacillus sp. 598K]